MKNKAKPKKTSKHARQLSELKRRFLDYYSKLPIQKLAAEYIGKDEDTITNWKKNDKKFSDQLGIAKSEWVLNNVSKVKKIEWLLERLVKEHFVEKKEVVNDTNIRLDAALDRISKMLP